MNKYQEAFNELKHIIKVQSIDFDEIRYQKVEKYLNLLSKLVDKATPIKQKDRCRCPKCNAYIVIDGDLVLTKNYYCWHCGQALDWS